MSRIAYCICGLFPAGTIPAFDITNGWFWLFPPAGDVLPDPTNFPFPFNILDCVRLYWNINEITLDLDITFTPDEGDPTTVTDTGTFAAQDNDGNPITDEQQLIGNHVNFMGTTPGGTSTMDLVSSRLNIDAGALFPLFSPNINGFSFASTMFSTGLTVVSNIPSINSQTLYGGDSSAANWTGTVTINATSFWSYDGVFDSATGTQLIIPAPKGL